jgi:hypothetical protein
MIEVDNLPIAAFSSGRQSPEQTGKILDSGKLLKAKTMEINRPTNKNPCWKTPAGI